MAYADLNRSATADAPTSLVARIATTLADWRQSMSTRKALHALTDRELEDIGLARGDIDRLPL